MIKTTIGTKTITEMNRKDRVGSFFGFDLCPSFFIGLDLRPLLFFFSINFIFILKKLVSVDL